MNDLLRLVLVLVGNHLWQSTLFALAIAGLTLLLRRNSARLRYWLWLVASIKFLVPFAALAALGAQIPWHPVVAEQGAAAPVVLDIAGDFTAPMAFDLQQVPANGAATPPEATLPLMWVFAAWAMGAGFVSVRWLTRWLEVRRALHNSVRMTGIDFPVPVRATSAGFEPGIVGIFRPSLLVPAGIQERLTPAQMQAVLAHERCHLRCRDNLAASLHMRVEVLFWFHPLVWWIGARLIEERERACDEEVVREGHSAAGYAEGILAVCEHYIASRLRSVSGVSGADLRKRIERIARKTLAVQLGRPKKLILAGAMGCLIAAPIGAGMIAASTWQVLFSLEPYTAAMVEHSRLFAATLDLQNKARPMGDPGAFTCPAPTSSALEQRRNRLAALVSRFPSDDRLVALLYAVAANSASDVKRLLTAEAVLALLSSDGQPKWNPLMHTAALFSDPPILQLLADHGMSVDGWAGPFSRLGNGSARETPLMVAISAGRRDNIAWLIQHGADVDATNEAGYSALVTAMVTCHDQQLVTQLLRAGATPDRKAQKTAATLGFNLNPSVPAAATAALAGAGAQYHRATALWEEVMGTYAASGPCTRRNAEIRQKQERLAATIAGLSAGDGEKVLFYAVMAGSAADVRRLLAQGAPLTGDNEYPLLHTAAQFGEPEMLEALVHAGLAVGALDSRKTSALHAAASEGRKENMAWLIQHGANVNALNDQGASVLAYAALCRDQDLVDMLIRVGARPDMRSRMVATNTGVMLPDDRVHVPAPGLVRGWRAPTATELNREPGRNSSPTKYARATADLDGDGRPDQAAILIAVDESMEGLFVKLSSHNPGDWTFAASKYRRPGAGTNSGISVREPGRIPNMCEKGYRPCGPAEPRLVLKHQGIDYFEFESAASVVYWDAANTKFRQAWYAD